MKNLNLRNLATTLGLLFPILAAGNPGDTTKIQSPQTMLDLVGENKPTTSVRNIDVYTDTTFNGEACTYSYGSTSLSGVEYPALMSGTAAEKQAQFNKDIWKLTTWVVNQNYPQACNRSSSMTRNTTASGILRTLSSDGINNNMTFQFFGNRVLLSSRSIDFWSDVYGVGTALFRSASDYVNVSWPNNFITKNVYATNPLSLSQMNSLTFTFDAALGYANVNTTRVN